VFFLRANINLHTKLPAIDPFAITDGLFSLFWQKLLLILTFISVTYIPSILLSVSRLHT